MSMQEQREESLKYVCDFIEFQVNRAPGGQTSVLEAANRIRNCIPVPRDEYETSMERLRRYEAGLCPTCGEAENMLCSNGYHVVKRIPCEEWERMERALWESGGYLMLPEGERDAFAARMKEKP